MVALAHKQAEQLGLSADCRLMDAEAINFPDKTFDTVVSALSTCTFPDPITALREMGRVCKNDGRILLLEHGRSRWTWLGQFQDYRAHSHFQKAGCRWNQEPTKLIEAAGLQIVSARQIFLGVFYAIVAMPLAE